MGACSSSEASNGEINSKEHLVVSKTSDNVNPNTDHTYLLQSLNGDTSNIPKSIKPKFFTKTDSILLTALTDIPELQAIMTVLFQGTNQSLSWTGTGYSNSSKSGGIKFYRDVTFSFVNRANSIVTNPYYSGATLPPGSPANASQSLLTFSTTYSSYLPSDSTKTNAIDQASGFWSFDYTGGTGNVIPYYLEANFHGVCVLYRGDTGITYEPSTGFVTTNNMTAVWQQGIISNDYLSPLNSGYGSSNPFTFAATFQNSSIEYFRQSKHPAFIEFSPNV